MHLQNCPICDNKIKVYGKQKYIKNHLNYVVHCTQINDQSSPDYPGYIMGELTNTGNEIIVRPRISVFFLDSQGNRIAETELKGYSDRESIQKSVLPRATCIQGSG